MIKLNRIGNKLGLAGAIGVLLAAGMVANQMVSEFDFYRDAIDQPGLLYFDDLKIGDTYAVVQP